MITIAAFMISGLPIVIGFPIPTKMFLSRDNNLL